jgi:hypothetical protein
MNIPPFSSTATEIATIVTRLSDAEQKRILYFVKLESAKKWAKKLDTETKKIKDKRPTITEISTLIRSSF